MKAPLARATHPAAQPASARCSLPLLALPDPPIILSLLLRPRLCQYTCACTTTSVGLQVAECATSRFEAPYMLEVGWNLAWWSGATKRLHAREQVSAGQQGRPKVTGRRTQLLSQSARAELRRAGSGKSEDSNSAAATDSEADSITTDGGSHKRKPGSKKGAHPYRPL